MLGQFDGVTVHDLGRNPAAIVSFTLPGANSAAVAGHLADLGINVSVSALTSTPIDRARCHLPDLVRASPHYYNTEDEIERLVEAVKWLSEH